MIHRALVVDDDPDVIEVVGDILRSLGHEHDDATCQEEARHLLASNQYSYYLVDLEIPVQAGRGFSRIQNGENLVAEIVRRRETRREPIIVITGHGKDGPELAVQLMKLGADDYVTKPFAPTGNTLDKAIEEALARTSRHGCRSGAPQGGPAVSADAPVAFTGGDLVFFQYRVELCGAKVCGGNGLIRKVLDALKPRRASGKYVAYSGHELAAEVDCPGEVNRVAGVIRDFRQEAIRVLREELNLQCGTQDVIQSGGPGYRYNEWITVRDGDGAVTVPSGEDRGTVNGTLNDDRGTVNGTLNDERGTVNGTLNAGRGTVNDCRGTLTSNDGILHDAAECRQHWILTELGRGRQLRLPTIAGELKCSQRTVRRDLDSLRALGKIEYVGPARTGYYQLKR